MMHTTWWLAAVSRKCLLLALFFAILESQVLCKEGDGEKPKGDGSGGKQKNEKQLSTDLIAIHDPSIRPDATVSVNVQLLLMTVNALDTKTQTLSTTGYISLTWTDSRLSWNESSYGVKTLFLSGEVIWIPHLLIANDVRRLSIVSQSTVPVKIRPDGELVWRLPTLMDTSCAMDIIFYPFDTQVCFIDVASLSYLAHELVLQGISVNTLRLIQNGEWDLLETDVEEAFLFGKRDSESTVRFKLVFSRRPTYYVLNAVIPSILMSFLAPLAFVLPASSGERISYVITVFLAVVVMLTLILEQLPSSSRYPSLFSVYLTVITVLAALAVPLTISNLTFYEENEGKPVSSTALKIGSCMRKVTMKKNENKIAPSEGVDIKTEDNTEEKSNTDTLTYRELARLLDVLYFRMFMVVTLGVEVLFFMMLTFFPR